MTEPKLKDSEPILATDFVGKRKRIIEELDNTVFNINENDLYEEIKGDLRKRTTKKGEVKPTLTATRVACKLDALFFLFPPISEAKSLNDEDYTKAFCEFMELMEYINNYVIMTANKQLFCGFVGISVNEYNEMLTNPKDTVINRINDRFISTDLVSAESGLLDSRAVITKMEAKDLGHSMKKAEQSVVNLNLNNFDGMAMLNELNMLEERKILSDK